MTEDKDQLPGNGLLGWLGRQIGYVAKAVKTDVTAQAGQAAATTPPPPPPTAAVDSKVVYRECKIEEKESPVDPNVKFRRTVIDEVIQESQNAECRVQNEEKTG